MTVAAWLVLAMTLLNCVPVRVVSTKVRRIIADSDEVETRKSDGSDKTGVWPTLSVIKLVMGIDY